VDFHPAACLGFRTDPVLKLDGAVKRESNNDSHEEVPGEGHLLTTID
jgi:hypothetical protein